MAYKEFSYFYDYFNYNADYDALYSFIKDKIEQNNRQEDNIVCDLGCGTGELTLRFCKDGYDTVAVDNSSDMLDVLLEKKYEYGYTDLLILNQDITKLDMYGTIDVFTCTFDTVNHLDGEKSVQQLFGKVSLFMHPDGVFFFDANTPYKHKEILANSTFDFDEEEASCRWSNTLIENQNKTKISIQINDKSTNNNYHEEFYECFYDISKLKEMLKKSKLEVIDVVDGENFKELTDKSLRYLFVVKKEK